MVKVKSYKTKMNVLKSNWAEDDLSIKTSGLLESKKKKKLKKPAKHSEKLAAEIAKNDHIKRKEVRKAAKDGTDDDDFKASLDKLKEIDPDFYKVIKSYIHYSS